MGRKFYEKIHGQGFLGRVKLAMLIWWIRHHRFTSLIMRFCRTLELAGPGGYVQITIETYNDVKTFKEVFIDQEYAINTDPASIRLIIDLGANIGYTTALFMLKYPFAKIISVEPDTRAYKRLKRVAESVSESSGSEPRIILHRVAISDHIGTANLHYVSEYTVSSSLIQRKGTDATVQVETTTLSELLKEYASVDFLKVDIEGSERFVFADPAVRKAQIIAAEIHPDLAGNNIRNRLMETLQGYHIEERTLKAGRSILKAYKHSK